MKKPDSSAIDERSVATVLPGDTEAGTKKKKIKDTTWA
jgi:hypothetical protein